MASPLGELTTEQFLQNFWQKKPCLIRNALLDYDPPLDANDIAGLACEEMAESRLVRGRFPQNDWQLSHGPFDEDLFALLPESDWTLLVQDVEKHFPPLQDLMTKFYFLPSWRLDDLMVSYAVPGGSVGPHVDQYDVFLYQAQGRRMWQIAEQFEEELIEDCPLNVLSHFEAQQEWILNPGDMLYLPPGIAHHGVALDECMTWSIGLRAPSTADLMQTMGEYLANRPDDDSRYSDPGLKAHDRQGEIDAVAIERLRDLLVGSINDPDVFKPFAGEFLTRFRLAQEPVSPDPDLDRSALLAKLQAGARLIRNPWTRLAWIDTHDGALLFAAGTAVECSIPVAVQICAELEPELVFNSLDEREINAILALLNGGHLVLSHD